MPFFSSKTVLTRRRGLMAMPAADDKAGDAESQASPAADDKVGDADPPSPTSEAADAAAASKASGIPASRVLPQSRLRCKSIDRHRAVAIHNDHTRLLRAMHTLPRSLVPLCCGKPPLVSKSSI